MKYNSKYTLMLPSLEVYVSHSTNNDIVYFYKLRLVGYKLVG